MDTFHSAWRVVRHGLVTAVVLLGDLYHTVRRLHAGYSRSGVVFPSANEIPEESDGTEAHEHHACVIHGRWRDWDCGRHAKEHNRKGHPADREDVLPG